MDTVLDIAVPDRDERHDHDLPEDLIERVREHMCLRCHYETDEDGYCAMCGATTLHADT
jgi:hypothetical protein